MMADLQSKSVKKNHFLIVAVLVCSFLFPPTALHAAIDCDIDTDAIIAELVLTIYTELLILQASLDDDTEDEEGEAMPVGQAAIDYLRAANPGTQVRAAADGSPIFPITIYPPPSPANDNKFCDNVVKVIVDGLIIAIEEYIIIPVDDSDDETDEGDESAS